MNRNLKLFLIALLSWSGLSFGAITTIPADVTGQIQVTKSGLVYNRNTKTFDTNLTLTNTSQVKIYGPVQLSAVISNPNNVSLANSTGISAAGHPTIVITPYGGVLNPGEFITNLVLKFNDPSQVKFTYEAKFDGVVEVSRIDQLSPSQASSAAKITLVGAGFTPASRVILGTQSVTPQYVSNTQLTFVVPFSLDQNSALVPLQAGQYTIQVDGSNTVNLNVVDLPVNPNPPGQLLTDQITSTFQSLSVNIPAFQANLPQLLSDQQNNPSAQKFIQDLANLANLVNTTSVQTELTKLTNQIDLQTMDTLERSLLVNKNSSSNAISVNSLTATSPYVLSSNAIIKAQTSSFFSDCNSEIDGNLWLECRKNDSYNASLSSSLNNMASGCLTAIIQAAAISGKPELVGTPQGEAITFICLFYKGTTLFLQSLQEFNIAKYSGVIQEFKLKVNGSELTQVLINNYDNNLTTQTTEALNITGAELKISNKPNWVNITNSVFSVLFDKIGVKLTNDVLNEIFTRILEIAADKVQERTNDNDNSVVSKTIIPNYIIGTLGLTTEDCDIKDRNSSYYLQSSLTNKTNNRWGVPDMGTVTDGSIINGSCMYKVHDNYRLQSEDGVKTTVDFAIKRYPKFTLNVVGSGSVTYSPSPVSKNTSCTSAKQCIEYINTTTQLQQVTLTAKNANGSAATSIKWSGTGMSGASCAYNNATCVVILDPTNKTPPVITANLSKGVFWVGTYTITNCVAPNYAGSGDPCKFAMKHGAYWNSGEIRFRQDSSEQLNVRRDFTIGGNSSVQACEGYTINISTGATGFDFTEDLTGLFSSSSEIEPVHFTMNQSLDNTQSAITGTFTGSFNYTIQDCTTGCPYHLKSGGLVQGTWRANKTNQPFSKCNMQNVADTGYHAIITGYTLGWRSPNSIPSADEWVNFP